MSQIAAKLTQSLARLKEKIPDQKVGLVAADAFFSRKVDLPEGLSREERVAFVQLNLEGNSPFPMDQLAWGFLLQDSSPHAFVYATPRNRLRRLEIENPEGYYQLFPGFITLHGQTVDRPTVRFLSQNGVLSAIYLLPRNPVPVKILSRKIAAEVLTDPLLLEARAQMAASLPADEFKHEDGLWLGSGLGINQDGGIEFRHRHVSKGSPAGESAWVLPLDENGTWEADIRDDAHARKVRNIRQRSSLIWTSLRVAIWLAIVLAVLQLGNLALAGLNIYKEMRIQGLEPQATRVENKITLAERLTQSTEEDLKPFLLLESINPLRPDSVFFEKVRSRAFNELEIEGLSTEGVTPVNAFADAIKKQAFVKAVEVNSQTRNNQTSWELIITFSQLPPEPEGGMLPPPVEQADTEGGN